MRSRLIIPSCIGLLFLSATWVAGSHDIHDADRAAIRKGIESIFEAFIHRDRETLSRTHSDDWQGFDVGSRTVMPDHAAYMKNADATIKGPGGMSGYKILDYDTVFASDNVAVVNYVADVDFSTGTGQINKTKFRISDVYAKRNNDWVQVSSNTDLHPEIVIKQNSTNAPLSDALKQRLMKERDAVWRASIEGDRKTLEASLAEEALAINSPKSPWQDRAKILADADDAAKAGVKVTKLDFPRTEFQAYGYTFILYSRYDLEVEVHGQKHRSTGTATEIFLIRDRKFVNTGWQLAPDGQAR